MLTLIFLICIIGFVFKVSFVAIKATWGITKFIFGVLLFPIVLLALIFSGAMSVAAILFIIAAIVLLVKSRV